MSPLFYLMFSAFALTADSAPALKVVDVRAAAGDWIVLRAETDGTIVRWKSLDRGLRLAPPELTLRDAKITIATANQPGKYRVVCVTAKGDVPSEIVEFNVIVEAEGPAPAPPVPPTPVDPLLKQLREAFTNDVGELAVKREQAKILSGFYRAMTQHIEANNVASVGDLLSDYRNAIPTLLPESALPGTRKFCGEQVALVAGNDPTRVIDASLKSKFVELFTRLASALDALLEK